MRECWEAEGEEEEGGKRGCENENRRKTSALRNQERETKGGRGRQREARFKERRDSGGRGKQTVAPHLDNLKSKPS